jgi:hypothetical protein
MNREMHLIRQNTFKHGAQHKKMNAPIGVRTAPAMREGYALSVLPTCKSSGKRFVPLAIFSSRPITKQSQEAIGQDVSLKLPQLSQKVDVFGS